MGRIAFSGEVAVSHEGMLKNIAHARALGFPYVREEFPHGRRLAVVGGGPSIVDHLDEIRSYTDVWAINGACGFLRERGIVSTLLACDPVPFLAERVRGAKTAILCSRCDPAVFDALKGAEITLFDALQDKLTGGYATWLSVSAMSAVFQLSMAYGFRQTVFYGCEGSYESTTHAYMDDPQGHRFVVSCGGGEYLTVPELYIQCQQMAPLFRLSVSDAFTERSGGLLRAMIQNEDHDIVKVSRALLASLETIKEAA